MSSSNGKSTTFTLTQPRISNLTHRLSQVNIPSDITFQKMGGSIKVSVPSSREDDARIVIDYWKSYSVKEGTKV